MHKNNNAGDVIKCQTTENMFYMNIHLKIAESVTTTCSVIVYGMIEVNSVYHSTIFCIIRFIYVYSVVTWIHMSHWCPKLLKRIHIVSNHMVCSNICMIEGKEQKCILNVRIKKCQSIHSTFELSDKLLVSESYSGQSKLHPII